MIIVNINDINPKTIDKFRLFSIENLETKLVIIIAKGNIAIFIAIFLQSETGPESQKRIGKKEKSRPIKPTAPVKKPTIIIAIFM